MNTTATGLERFTQWIGRTETRHDVATAAPLVSLCALLDRDDPAPRPGEPAPPLAHWLYFLPSYRNSEAGQDGHSAAGTGLLPEMPLPRRMWAGSRLEFLKPLRVGSEIERVSTIRDVKVKSGRSGSLVFVTVHHEVRDGTGTVLSDEHDIVFREPGTLAIPPTPAPEGPWQREIRPDPLLLFRYSAVTFNGHRIHYDHPYVTQVEGYPGLVVHGPLIATLLVDLFRRNKPQAQLRRYSFRALRPLYDTHPFRTCGAPDEVARAAKLWTRDHEGAMTMDATAEW